MLTPKCREAFPADFGWSSSDQIDATTLHSMNIYVHKSVIYGVLLCITPLRCPTEIVHPVMIDESTSNSAKSAASSARTEPSMHTALALALHHRHSYMGFHILTIPYSSFLSLFFCDSPHERPSHTFSPAPEIQVDVPETGFCHWSWI